MSQDQSHQPLRLPTNRSGVILRELSTPEDDRAYFDAVEASRSELDRTEGVGRKYRTIGDVEKSRVNADHNKKLRMGIWDKGDFVGSVNATVDERGDIEIGYWTDSRYTGRGYATLAAHALAAYAAVRYGPGRVFAEVAADNRWSEIVLERAGFQRAPHRRAHQLGYLAYELANQE